MGAKGQTGRDLSGLVFQANMMGAPIEAQCCRLINSANGLVMVLHAADIGVVQLEWFVATPPAATSPVSYLPHHVRGVLPNRSALFTAGRLVTPNSESAYTTF